MRIYPIVLCLLLSSCLKLYSQTPVDLNAEAYIHAAGITSDLEKKALNTFVRALKYYDIWNNIHALYVPTGGTELSHALNLKDPRNVKQAFNLLFPHGATHTLNGVDWDGATQFAKTWYHVSSTRLHISVYTDEINTTAYMIDGPKAGEANGAPNARYSCIYPMETGLMNFSNGANITTGINNNVQSGFFYGQRMSGDSVEGYLNGNLLGRTLQKITGFSDTSSILWINRQFSRSGRAKNRFQLVTIGNAMSPGKVQEFYRIVQAFLSQLGIQYGPFTSYPAVPITYISPATYGYRWQMNTPAAVPTQRDGIVLDWRNDSLYIYGGWNPAVPGITNNDIWVAGGNFSTFTQAPPAAWAKRHTPVYCKDDSGYFYIIGSDYLSNVNQQKEVWRTKDGRNFTRVISNSAFGPRIIAAGCYHNGAIYIGGGQVDLWEGHGIFDDLYKSVDGGQTFTLVRNGLYFLGGNMNQSMVSYNGKIYAYKGGHYDGTQSERSFGDSLFVSADDGMTWRGFPVPFQARQYTDLIVWDNKIWFIAGNTDINAGGSYTGNLSDVWYMTPDEHIYELGSTPFYLRHATSSAVDKKNNRLVIACGNMHTDVWSLRKLPLPTVFGYTDRDVYLQNNCSYIVPNFADSLESIFREQADFVQTPAAGTVINAMPGQSQNIVVTGYFAVGDTQINDFALIAKDTLGPVFSCQQNKTVYLGNNCSIVVPDVLTGIGATDCSGPSTFTQLPAAGTVISSASGQTHNISITATDALGNKTFCTTVLTASDTSAPVFSAVSNITRANTPGTCGTNVTITPPVATDNCAGVTVTASRSDGFALTATFPVGATTITWKATDSYGNNVTMYQAVDVTDSERPLTTSTAEIKVCSKPDNTYTVPAITATDNCAIASVAYTITGATARIGLSKDASGIFNPGTSVITWSVKDIHNNISTCQTIVNINAPLTVAIPDIHVLPQGVNANTLYIGYGPDKFNLKAIVQGSFPPYSYRWSTGETTDSVVINENVLANGIHTLALTVTDEIGCHVDATKTVEVMDIRCGENHDKVSVCEYLDQKLISACINASAVPEFLAAGSYLGICANNIPGVLTTIPANTIRNNMQVAIMPNPASQFFTIKIQSIDNNHPVNIRIVDAIGMKWDEKTNITPGTIIRIGQNYPSGIYFLELHQGNERLIYKLIKKKE